MKCTVAECEGNTHAKGMCEMHYARKRRTGKIELKESPSLQDRFWKMVNKTDGCWLWVGGKNNYGYGSIWLAGRRELTHRLSWMLHNGPIKDDLCVLHHCDTPACVRPSHLFLGTQLVNVADAVAKGRQSTARGERCVHAKLISEQVITIRARRESTSSALAKEFGMSKRAIQHIRARTRWAHLL